MNPANPTSPTNLLNPANPASPLWPGHQQDGGGAAQGAGLGWVGTLVMLGAVAIVMVAIWLWIRWSEDR